MRGPKTIGVGSEARHRSIFESDGDSCAFLFYEHHVQPRPHHSTTTSFPVYSSSMKVLIVGAAGRLGQRLAYYFLSAGHDVTAFVRSSSRFLSLLPADIAANPSLKVFEGDALQVSSLTQAIRESSADAVINCAGFTALLPWQSSSFPDIGKAVADACLDALGEGKRVWMVAGMFVCDRPGGGLIMDSNHLYHESRILLEYLQSKGATLNWAMLCPGLMQPGDAKPLEEGYDLPPRWPVPGWLCRVPIANFFAVTLAAAAFYTVSFDSVAAWMVQHLEDEGCRGKRVGVRVRS